MVTKIVWVVSKGQYSDRKIVAIKSNEEAARILMSKCSYCNGSGKDPYFEDYDCYHCVENKEPQKEWNKPDVFEVEDT